jgi:MFS family permease
MVPSPADRPDPGCPDPSGVLTAVDSPRPEEPVRPRVVLAACSVGLFLAFLQITQTISALGAIQLDLGLSGAQLVWVPSAYTLAVATFVLSGGAVGDRWGRRSTYRAGIALTAAGAALVAASDGLIAVVAGQALAGVGAAAVLPNSLSILTATFTDPVRRARAIAVWIGASGVGLAVGPLLAGAVQRWFGWNAVFLGTLPVAAVALMLTAAVPESRAPAHRLDRAGQVLAVVGLAALVFGLIEGGQQGYRTGAVLTAFAVAVLGLAGFVAVELRTPAPMFDVRLLARPAYSVALVVAAVGLFGFVGVTLLQVLFLQRVQGLTPWDSAVRLSAEMATFVLVTLLAGRLVPRTGPRRLLVGGSVLAGAGGAWRCQMVCVRLNLT